MQTVEQSVLNVFVLCTIFIQGDANRDILCTDSLTCSEHHRILWFRMRKHVKNILNFMNYNGYEYQKRRLQYDDPSIYSLKMRYMLCREVQSVGFMIDSQSDQWPIRCLWNGNAMNGTCAPGPPSNLSVFYITPKEWQQKVKEFRIKIGCSGKDIENANKLDELYVCKERCIQAGIGYVSSLFIMTTLLVSLTLVLMT